MSFAFGHLIGAWILGKVYELISRKKIPHLAWFFLFLGGILPDVDYLIDWTLGIDIHRTLTHSFFFLIVAPLILYGLLSLLQHPQKKNSSCALSAGILSHLLLDIFGSGHGIPLFWPSVWHISINGVTYNPLTPGLLNSSATALREALKHAIWDMSLGTTWIFFLCWRKRIRF